MPYRRDEEKKAPYLPATRKARYWKALVDEWRRSGLSQAEFCRRKGLVYRTFSWWKWALQRQASENSDAATGHDGQTDPPCFLPVRVVTSAVVGSDARGAIEVVLAGGRRIRVRDDFDAAVFTKVVRLLEEQP